MNEEEKYCYEDRSDIPACQTGNRRARALTALFWALGALVLTLVSATVGAVLGAAGERREHAQKTNVVFYQGNEIPPHFKNEDGSLTKAGVVDYVRQSVVEVSAIPRSAGKEAGKAQVASGLVVSADGYIVTDYSVVEDVDDIRVRLTHKEDVLSATLYAKDSVWNLAVLKVQATELTPVCFGDPDSLDAGQEVLAVGMTNGNGVIVNDGIVSVPHYQVNFGMRQVTAIRTTADLGESRHGGGLFNMAGQLVGFFGETPVTGDGVYALPMNRQVRLGIKDLIEKKFVTGRVNVNMVSLRECESESDLLPVGLYVCAVNAPTCPFRKGDAILFVNENRVDGMKHWTRILNCYEVGEEVTVTVKRDGEEVDLKITLEETEK